MQRLFELFEEMGYKSAEGFFRQGSLSTEKYPAEFFTFWNVSTPQDAHYDNELCRFTEYVQVGFYTNDAEKIYSIMDGFIEKAKTNGFTIAALPQDADSGKDGYFGRVCFIRIQNKT